MSLHDKELESFVLSSCFNANCVFPSVSEEMFYYDSHKRILKAFKEELFFLTQDQLKTFKVHSEDYERVLDHQASSFEPTQQIKALRNLQGRRLAIADANELIRKCQDLETPEDQLPIETANENYILDREKLIDDFIEYRSRPNLDFGFGLLNTNLSKFDVGMVWYIAGRSGTGKTGFGLQVLDNICYATKTHGLFYSIEMEGIPIAERRASQYFYKKHGDAWSDETAQDMIQDSREFAKTCDRETINKFIPSRYDMCVKPAVTLKDITFYIRHLRRQGKEIQTILIDYIGLMKQEAGDRRNEVSIIARGLKELAKQEQVRVICLTQTTRGAEDGTVPVKLHQLKESGDIEESADIVTGLWRSATVRHSYIGFLKIRHGGILGKSIIMTDGSYFRTPTENEIEYFRSEK